MEMAGIDMTLSYQFEPGSPRDGVTMTVPLLRSISSILCVLNGLFRNGEGEGSGAIEDAFAEDSAQLCRFRTMRQDF